MAKHKISKVNKPVKCGLRTHPRTDVDPQRFLDPWSGLTADLCFQKNCGRELKQILLLNEYFVCSAATL